MSSPVVLTFLWRLPGRFSLFLTEINITSSPRHHQDSPGDWVGWNVWSIQAHPDRCAEHDDCLQNHELGRDCWEQATKQVTPFGLPSGSCVGVVRVRLDGAIVDMTDLQEGRPVSIREEHPIVLHWPLGSILSLYVVNDCFLACHADVRIEVTPMQSGLVNRGTRYSVGKGRS